MKNIVKSEDYGYFERKSLMESLCMEYSFLSSKTIGLSCAGRDITALKVGAADEYALIAAAFHGSERITATVLLKFIEELCYALKQNGSVAGLNAKRAMYGRGAIFVPCVNPDGCEIALKGETACGALAKTISRLCNDDFEHWNANLRGVDINHNFSAGWHELHKLELSAGIKGPAPTRFGGYKPESEPETLSLTELCRTTRIRHALALHTQGEVIYWNYGDKKPPRSQKMAEIMATSSGYTLDKPEGLAVGGGFKDWFIEEFNRPGFTVELGLGKNPLPLSDIDAIYNTVKEMLMLSVIM